MFNPLLNKREIVVEYIFVATRVPQILAALLLPGTGG